MKIGIIGATGNAGSLILEKTVARKLDVTAIVRSPEKLEDGDFEVLKRDASDVDEETLKPFDVVINALGFEPENAEKIHEYGKKIIDAANNIGGIRFITIGHAGTLFKDEESKENGDRMFESDTFPEDFKPVARNHLKNLELLQEKKSLKWTFMCPASFFDPEGSFSGKYELGSDIRVKNSEDKSYISYEDFASAVVDEVVNSNHINEQVSVVGENE